MPRFDKCHIKELQEILYYSHIHDAKLENVRYERGKDRLIVETFNPIFNVGLNLTFCDVGIVLAINGNELGRRETIISLTAEEDFSYFQKYIQQSSKSLENSLYLLFQMFSGDELHIVSKEVNVEIVR